MPVNMNRLIATNEVRLKPGVDSVSETKTNIVVTEKDSDAFPRYHMLS